MSIQVHDIVKSYGNQLAVNRVSFEAHQGEIIGFLGPNGAGKSTTMKMITGYLKPDEGQVLICGIDVAESGIEAKKRLGYLPEQNPLYSEMYVREFLDFQRAVYGTHKESVQKVIEQVGLGSEAHKKIGQLSKGYQQRVGLAAAILHDPDVLILDEPTTGLDPNQLTEIRKLLKTLGAEKTILLSTHIMSEVEALCDRVIIIDKGEIKWDTPIDQLPKNLESLFAELTN